jgi:hypothetical protein
MALLTEEQIQDLYLQLDNVSSTSAMQTIIKEWNEKQPSTQFEPDWSKAPEGTDSVIIKSYWVNDGIWTFGENVTKYDRPAPINIPHPHAAIMAKYAEVAARRVDPWVEFEQYSYCDEDWFTLEVPTFFDTHLEYRYIGGDK